MDNFNLKQYITEGRLYKEAQDNTGGVSFDDNETTQDPVDELKQIFIDNKGFPGDAIDRSPEAQDLFMGFAEKHNLDQMEFQSLKSTVDEWYWDEYDLKDNGATHPGDYSETPKGENFYSRDSYNNEVDELIHKSVGFDEEVVDKLFNMVDGDSDKDEIIKMVFDSYLENDGDGNIQKMYDAYNQKIDNYLGEDNTGGVEFVNDENGEMPWDENHPDWEEDTRSHEEKTIAMLDGSASIKLLKNLEDTMRIVWSYWNDEGFEKEDMIKWFQWKLDNI